MKFWHSLITHQRETAPASPASRCPVDSSFFAIATESFSPVCSAKSKNAKARQTVLFKMTENACVYRKPYPS